MRNPDPFIVVVGGPAMDLLARVRDFPAVDGNAPVSEVLRLPGGMAANVAVALARLGQRVMLHGVTGDDALGDELCARLTHAGVDVSQLLRRKNTPAHSCFIAVNPAGERMIFGLPGIISMERPEELHTDTLRQARAVHIGPGPTAIAAAAVAAARAGQAEWVTYAPGDILWFQGAAGVLEITPLVDVLIVNRVEAHILTGLDTPQAAVRALSANGTGIALVTAGPEGVWLGAAGEVEHIPAFHTANVSDTTGAGDAFTAGVLTGLLRGEPPREAARLGSAVAALKIRQPGAQAGLPDLESALALRAGKPIM